METTDCSFCGEKQVDFVMLTRDIAFDNPGQFPLVSCMNCKLIYLQERPTSEEINQYYPPEYLPYRTAIQDEPSGLMRWMRERNINKRVEVITSSSNIQPGSILDIGCSTGIFLDAMRNAGWDTLGVEIAPDALNYARTKFNLNVLPGQLLDHELPSESLDAVTFWDVLEHTYDPFSNLLEANRILRIGGVLALTIPYWDSLDRKIFGEAWIGYDSPRHLYVFPSATLFRMLHAAGFQTEKAWTGLGGYFTFLASLRLWLKIKAGSQSFRSGVMKFFELPGMRIPFQPIFSLLDSLNLGGTLVIVARKPSQTDPDSRG